MKHAIERLGYFIGAVLSTPEGARARGPVTTMSSHVLYRAVALAAEQAPGNPVTARAQMATTLGFHIILACMGIALPSVVLLVPRQLTFALSS